MKRSRRYQGSATLVPPETPFGIDEAIGKLKAGATAKFDETAEVTLSLGIRASQVVVRGTCNLPHGTGKAVRVLAFAKGESVTEAEQAGADFVGGEDLAERGWDRRVVTTIAAMIAGDAVLLIFGFAWLAMLTDIKTALIAGLLSFIPGDILKVVIAAAVLPTGWKLLEHLNLKN